MQNTPPVVEIFSEDAAAGGYVYTRPGKLSALTSNRRQSRAILDAASFAGKRVVDLGCGDGTYTLEFVTLGRAASVLGVDPAQGAIVHAEKLLKARKIADVSFLQASIDDFTPETPFDIAVLRGVLHHMDDPEAAIAKALKVARQVVILEPNGLNIVLKLIEKLSAYHRRHGERSFLPSTLEKWVAAGGGVVTKRSFINLVPFFCPDALVRILATMEPIVEAIPVLRNFACGQCLLVCEGGASRGQ